jgi:hypothetical protein
MAQGILEWKVYTPGSATRVSKTYSRLLSLNVWPNPVTDNFTVEVGEPGEAELVILNSSGQQLYKTLFTGRLTLNSSVTGGKGVYYCRVTVNGLADYRKIIII